MNTTISNTPPATATAVVDPAVLTGVATAANASASAAANTTALAVQAAVQGAVDAHAAVGALLQVRPLELVGLRRLVVGTELLEGGLGCGAVRVKRYVGRMVGVGTRNQPPSKRKPNAAP